MNESNITDEKLNILLRCLVKKFRNQYGQTTYKLSDYQFCVLDRMGCCKEAGLNYEFPAIAPDGSKTQAGSSIYVIALKELAHRGLVEFTGNNLTFVLTNKGYAAGLIEPIKMGKISHVNQWAFDHMGLIVLATLAVTIIGVLVS